MEIRVLIELNTIRVSVFDQKNNTSSSVESISDLGIEVRYSFFKGTFRVKIKR
jgi:hypothetical protein